MPGRGHAQDVGSASLGPFVVAQDLQRTGRTLRGTVCQQGLDSHDRTGLILDIRASVSCPTQGPHGPWVASYICLQQAIQHALNGAGDVVRFLIEGNSKGKRERVAEGGPNQLPGPHTGIECASEYSRLLSFTDNLCEQRLAVEIERAQGASDFLIVGF